MSRATQGTPVVVSVDHVPLVVEVDGVDRPRGSKCSACGQKVFPVANVCPNCHALSMTETTHSNTGVVYTQTCVHTGDGSPYVLAYVDLDDGVRLLGRVEGLSQIGDLVRVHGTLGDAVLFSREGLTDAR